MQVAGTTNDIESFKSQSIDKLKCEIYLLLLETDYIDTLNKQEPLYRPDWVEWRQRVRL